MAPPMAPSPATDLPPALQQLLPQLTKAAVEALMPEFQIEVLRLVPVMVNEILANTLMHRIRNEIKQMIPVIVVETLRKVLQFKGENNEEADASTTDDDVAVGGDPRHSRQPRSTGAKYSDVRVSDDEVLARFNEARRRQAVIQTKDLKNAGVAVEVSFEKGKNGKYVGAQNEGDVDWMGKGD